MRDDFDLRSGGSVPRHQSTHSVSSGIAVEQLTPMEGDTVGTTTHGKPNEVAASPSKYSLALKLDAPQVALSIERRAFGELET